VAQAGADEGLGMVWRENVRRFFDAHNPRGPVYLYTYVIAGLLAPWSLLLPAALVRAHQARDPMDRFALAFFWAVFVFFTLSSSRRSYYLLPVLPAAALLVARVVLAGAAELGPWARRLRAGGGRPTAGRAAVLPAAVLGGGWDESPGLPRPDLFVAGWLATAVSIGLSVARFTPARTAVAMVLIAAWGVGYGYLVALPDLEPYRTTRPFLARV